MLGGEELGKAVYWAFEVLVGFTLLGFGIFMKRINRKMRLIFIAGGLFAAAHGGFRLLSLLGIYGAC